MSSPKSKKTLKSACDSTTFDKNIAIKVEKELSDVGSATISPSGRDVAIASKSGLEIIDLDNPLNPPRHLRHAQSWLVADAQWSPFAARENWVASASNQKALIWNLTMSENSAQGAIEHTLHAHTRAITDINFSAHHADIIATCAVDGYVHAWDLRKPKRPVMTFCDWDAGATQVKWNRQDSHIIASSHDRWLRIWDDRFGAYPLKSIEAHVSKIYGVDWNRTRHTGIVTCSLDRSIKFWDYSKSEEEMLERVVRTEFPVWRARHTPFGWGLLAMPQNCPGHLYLYDRRKDTALIDEATPAVAMFEGHGNQQVKEFLWRARGGIGEDGMDNREFQLVSWGTDQHLRLQHVDAKVLSLVGYTKGYPVRKNLIHTRRGATYKTFRNVDQTNKDKTKDKINRPYSTENQPNIGALTDAAKKMTLPNAATGAKNTQIGWMSGIKIIPKSFLTRTSRQRSLTGRRLSLISPNFDVDWAGPESLHDEIIRVHKQFNKVSFDDVNMDRRIVTVSMHGPWGQSGDSTYVKVTMRFPSGYPESKVPEFTVHRSSMIADIMHAKIITEMEQIAIGFVERKRGCLEGAIAYLLGEVGLEESTIWLSENIDDHAVGVEDDSSSEDEDDVTGPSTNTSQELEASVLDGATAPSRHVNVPLPRYCGGVFAQNGKLVCFFPPKEDKIKSLLGSLKVEHDESSDEESGFNSFSKLRNELDNSKSKYSTLIEEDTENESDSSEDSETSSLSSSSSDTDSARFRLGLSNFWPKIRPAYRRNLSTKGSQKSSTIGTGTGTAFSKGRTVKRKSVVRLHDVGEIASAQAHLFLGKDIIPSKRELGAEYAIFGDGADVCYHNAKVAEKHGHLDRADIWRYAAMLLHHEVPLEVLDQSGRQEPILVIARTMLRRCRSYSASDSGVDMSYDEKPRQDKISARVKWGLSPVAHLLIEDLFNHYESLADVQMLAMLSCIFSEPSAEDGTARAECQVNQPETPLSMKTPGFSLDYFPTYDAARSAYQKGPYSTAASTPKALTPTAMYGSYGSSTGHWPGDPSSTSYSAGNTPPVRPHRDNSGLNYHPEAKSLGTSPDDKRSLRRGNSGFAASFSFSRPFSATAPSSPPGRKKPSSVEQIVGAMTPNTLTANAVTWGNNTVMGSKESAAPSRQSYSDDERQGQVEFSRPITGINITMHNQDLFDDEGCMSMPLLSIAHSAIYSNYRSAYSELLFAWGLQLPRLEIAKFSGLPDYFSTTNALRSPGGAGTSAFTTSIISNDAGTITRDVAPPSPIVLGKKDSVSYAVPTQQGVDVAAYCLKHESRLSPLTDGKIELGGATGRCERCEATKTQLNCVVCDEPVGAIYTPCLSCGCVSHQQCLREYENHEEFSDDESEDQEFDMEDDVGWVERRMCPGGCECECVRVASKGTVEDWGALKGIIQKLRLTHDATRAMDEEALLSPDSDREMEWESLKAGSNGKRAINGGSASTGRTTPTSTGQGASLAYGHLSRRLTQMSGKDWGKRKGSGLREA